MPPPIDLREEFFGAIEDQVLRVDAAAGILGSGVWEGTPSIVGDPDTTGLHGSLTVHDDGSFFFVPAGDFVGQTSFLIAVHDDNGTHQVSVNLEVEAAPNPPELRMADESLLGFSFAGDRYAFDFGARFDAGGVGNIVELAGGGYVATASIRLYDEEALPPVDEINEYVQVFNADGTPASDLIQLNTPGQNFNGSSLVALPEGGFVVALQPPEGGVKVQLRFFSATGEPGDVIEVGTVSYQYSVPTLVALSNGNILVQWYSEGSEIVGQIVSPAGDPVGDETIVSNLARGVADDQGGFVILTRVPDGGGQAVVLQRHGADGAAVGDPIIVRGGDETAESVAGFSTRLLADGSVVVSWIESDDPQGLTFNAHTRVVDPSGSLVGSEYVSPDIHPSVVFGTPVVAVRALADGGYVVAWETFVAPFHVETEPTIEVTPLRNRVYFQVFDKDGNAVSDVVLSHDVRAQTEYGATRLPPRIAVTSDGGFIIAHHQLDPTATGIDSLVQRYDAEGNRIGSEFLLSPGADSYDGAPAVWVLASGRIFVSWTGGAGMSPYIRELSFDGTVDGVEDAKLHLPLVIDINETDDSEVVTGIVITGLPKGSVVAGPDGTVVTYDPVKKAWTITGDIGTTITLTVTPPRNFHGDFDLKAIVLVKDAQGDAVARSGPLLIPIHLEDDNAGVTILGTGRDDIVDATHRPKGQALPTADEDRIFGKAGNDKLSGLGGDDLIVGGKGADEMRGGAGFDIFRFDALADFGQAGRISHNPGGLDRIYGFMRGEDVIDLSPIDARAGGGHDVFAFIGTKGFHREAGELRYEKLGKSAVIVMGDVTGNGRADFKFVVFGVKALGEADFDLV